ncbi:NADH dehydrogenase [Mycobacterium nebraskense]|uniref:NADH dehydrogenase n=2 Tax=Mycobacterium nebraskense TaxID=244292 RepID=A0A1X2A2A0_9MYCO|nr:proton-conducting transporter membrane subunit [Mycobacterium nebraskense]KKC03364.1 NADH dehydrogenase [Mycobacterium nebraskense]MBI2696058.1 NADH-quinone oxidoreductase subunit L [Mycobacterium nebraskense]MCV7115746.1 NADH-quinone oxidoreductase subunit L [Mycobacterium nebraskense]ORW35666.1 NADH dehydrogenase [Mycobacterium nebraskense]
MSMAQPSLWLLVGVPALVGGALLLYPRAGRVAAAISVSTSAVVVGLSIVVALTRPAVGVAFMAGADFALRADALAATVVPAVAAVTLLVLLFAVGDIRSAQGRFHGLMLVFAAAALLTATAATLPALLLAWEVMGAASYALIGFWWRDEFRVSAGLTAFVTTRTADLGLYLAAGAALAGGTGLTLAGLPATTGGWRHVVAAGVLVAALGKAAQLPFSFWISRAMEGPSPVSALLHSAAMVAMGGYLLLRAQPLLAATGWAATAAAWAGAVTAVLLGAVAVAQRDLKQLLAASTVAQLAFVVMAAGLGAISGGAAQLVAHAAAKAGLFLAAGAWLSLVGTKQLDDLWGIARRQKVIGWCATVGALSLAGVAPLSLWATKDTILAAALEHSLWLYLVGLLAAALSAGYAGKVLVVIWRTPARGDDREMQRSNIFQQAPLVILAGGAAVLGVLVLPPLGAVLSRAVNNSTTAHATAAELAGSAVLAIAVVAAVLRWGVPEPRWARAWLGLERATHLLVVTPTLGLAHGLARIDSRGIDGAVEAVAAATRRLGELARRPQAGLLHRYYIAGVVVVVALVLLLATVR